MRQMVSERRMGGVFKDKLTEVQSLEDIAQTSLTSVKRQKRGCYILQVYLPKTGIHLDPQVKKE